MVTRDVAVREQMAVLSPADVVENATAQAKLLMSIVEQTHCYQEIAKKKYLQVEAWETIGAFNNTHAETESVTPIVRDMEVIGYQAHVQLWKNGLVAGGAVMPCYFTENCCKGKEGDAKHKAGMSAAQTFATSKAYRMNFAYIAILAGYQPLPAEEVTEDMRQEEAHEHWCKEHNTAFFKRGKMKSFAHPIGDTGQWCHEHTAEKEPVQASGTPGPATDLMPREFKNAGEFKSACLKHFNLQPSQLEKEIPEFDLTNAGQREKAWQQILGTYGKRDETDSIEAEALGKKERENR